MPAFAPLAPIDGYLPIEDYGLLGDGATAALVGRDGAVAWLCVPRFDSPPLFARILDAERGGAFLLAPEELQEASQRYEGEGGVLLTDLRSATGTVRLHDALTLDPDADLDAERAWARGELVRHVQVVQGRVRLRVAVWPYGGAEAEPVGDALHIRASRLPELDLRLRSTRPLAGLDSMIELEEGDECSFALRWGERMTAAEPRREEPFTPVQRLHDTSEAWQRWAEKITYEGPHRAQVRRSAITLKMLDCFESGAIVAAATSSLPEAVGGERNWDYRYVWTRDASFTVYAFHRIGLRDEAAGFLRWSLERLERHGRPQVMYDIHGDDPPPERLDSDLHGYRGSRPVRWGNAAAHQQQHDVYGELLDCAYIWSHHHGSLDEALWDKLEALVEGARRSWNEPDHGIWEVRTGARPFTYSAALCQVALDRGARLATRFGLPGDVAGWRDEAERIRQRIIEDAWDERRGSFTEHLDGSGGLDASLLTLPLRRVIDARHPRMVATVEAILDRLSAGDEGLLYRYLPEESPDGVRGHEGAFLLCSFWLVDNLAMQGRLQEADELFDSLCQRTNPLGLLPEQIDPATGAFLGNFPQAFSHIGLISSAVNLARTHARQTG